jgi:predicted nucleic acid-binding protein
VLVDTSVWIEHLRRGSALLEKQLEGNTVLTHPFVIGEIACGNLRHRDLVLGLLADLPQAPVAEHGEVMAFVEVHKLMGQGLGWVDVQLLASAALARASIWSLDRRLASAADRLNLQ